MCPVELMVMLVLCQCNVIKDVRHIAAACWRCSSVVEHRSLIGELSLACTGPAADG